MSKIPLYTQTTHDWHCSKKQHPKPYAVDLNVGTNEYIFGRVTPDNKFIVSTGLVKDPKPYGIKMVGGKKNKKGGNVFNSGKTSHAVYNKENYASNELIYNALDKINQLNGLGSDTSNSMINSHNNISGGVKNKKKYPSKSKKSMKGGNESKSNPVKPNDSAVQNLAPFNKIGGKKAPKKKSATKKPVAKKPATKKPATKKSAKK